MAAGGRSLRPWRDRREEYGGQWMEKEHTLGSLLGARLSIAQCNDFNPPLKEVFSQV